MDAQGIPCLEEWVVDGKDVHVQGYMLANVRVADAVVLADFYWPRFVEYRGGVFLASRFRKQAVDDWFTRLEGDLRAVESVVNHIHLWDCFSPGTEAEYSALSRLAKGIAMMWECAARMELAGREVSVAVSDDPNGPTLTLNSVVR
jgi:hypothetical protein